MAEYNEFYSKARYYDIVFRRDVSREVEFLCELCKKYAGRQATSVLDLACGPGYHARACAQRGLRAVGLDLRPEMIEFARAEARAEGLAIEWLAADMREFRLRQPVSVALGAFDSLDCLLTNEDLVSHFRAIAANLEPNGLYLVDISHPRDCAPFAYGDYQYRGERDGCSVAITWATNHPVIDPVTQVIEPEVTMRVWDWGEELVFVDRAKERFFTAQELVLLADLSGALRVVDCFGAYDMAQPFDASPASVRMIVVLQKRAPAPTQFLARQVAVHMHPRGGYGIFAQERIHAGTCVVVFGGAILTLEQLLQIEPSRRVFSLQIDDHLYQLGLNAPDSADFVNHSCLPNLGFRSPIELVALRDIEAGDEVCFDYAMSESTPGIDEFDCRCDSSSCRGRVTAEDWKLTELQRRYGGFFSPYLQRRMAAPPHARVTPACNDLPRY